ncbi:Os03g0318275 [Oryza sativa Japonica Group]|uniref:Os03g0318275 protein n=1 Tax=Oryza sativa subsp. japonica TaxID=39947 RepID=A0A0P0VWQ5_ORYSJ|nr:Os03g0318275 [Oryza sativa Japonica Group]
MTRGTGGALRGSPALGDDDGLGASRCRTRWEAALACASRRSASISGCRCSATALTRPSAPPTSARRHRSGARRRPEAQQGRSSTATCDCSGDPERGKGAVRRRRRRRRARRRKQQHQRSNSRRHRPHLVPSMRSDASAVVARTPLRGYSPQIRGPDSVGAESPPPRNP